jgi:hypothetical protein
VPDRNAATVDGAKFLPGRLTLPDAERLLDEALVRESPLHVGEHRAQAAVVRLSNRWAIVAGYRVDAGPALRAHVRGRLLRLLVTAIAPAGPGTGSAQRGASFSTDGEKPAALIMRPNVDRLAMIRRAGRRIVFLPLAGAIVRPASITVACGELLARRAPGCSELAEARRVDSCCAGHDPACAAARAAGLSVSVLCRAATTRRSESARASAEPCYRRCWNRAGVQSVRRGLSALTPSASPRRHV